MGSVKIINDEAHFQAELSNAATRLVVADFTDSGCAPCQRIAPFFQQLAEKYPKAVFLTVDVDQCQETATAQDVSTTPTFIFYKNKNKLDQLQGAHSTALENKIQEYYGPDETEDAEEVNTQVDNTLLK